MLLSTALQLQGHALQARGTPFSRRLGILGLQEELLGSFSEAGCLHSTQRAHDAIQGVLVFEAFQVLDLLGSYGDLFSILKAHGHGATRTGRGSGSPCCTLVAHSHTAPPIGTPHGGKV